jgi:hypothetical protein
MGEQLGRLLGRDPSCGHLFEDLPATIWIDHGQKFRLVL